MSAILELLPMTTVSVEIWDQPLESIVDVSGYTEAAIFITVAAMDRQAGSTTVKINHAVDNREEQYTTLASESYSADPSMPDVQYRYCAGSTTGSNSAPGFGRYLRVSVDQAAAASITLSVKAVLKP